MTGPYFEVESPDDLSGWTTLSTLSSDRAVLRARVAATAAALGGVEHRAAASIDFFAVAARVLSPPLRSAVVDAAVPVLDPDTVRWHPARPGPMRLAMTVSEWRPGSAACLVEHAVRPVIVPLVAAYHAEFGVSERILWGNVAAALNGAATVLGSGDALVCEALSLHELAGTASALPPRFVRNSCCLYYRVPGGGLCGDCVLGSR